MAKRFLNRAAQISIGGLVSSDALESLATRLTPFIANAWHASDAMEKETLADRARARCEYTRARLVVVQRSHLLDIPRDAMSDGNSCSAIFCLHHADFEVIGAISLGRKSSYLYMLRGLWPFTSGPTSMNEVIQHGPDFHADRAASLLLIDELEQERQRILHELQRIDDRLTKLIDPPEHDHHELKSAAIELNQLLEKVNFELELNQRGSLQTIKSTCIERVFSCHEQGPPAASHART